MDFIELYTFIPAARKGCVEHADALVRTVFTGGFVPAFQILFLFFFRSDVDLAVTDLPADPLYLAVHLPGKLLELFPGEQISSS